MISFSNPGHILEETKLVDRFLEYVQIDTTADGNSPTCPSTLQQFDLAQKLVKELKDFGLSDAGCDENCYVTATYPGKGKNRVGLIAHLDTSPAAPGKNVKPILHENYQGLPISLKNDVYVDPVKTPELTQCIGDTIITSDGTTLLGADDKAGIAIIMSVIEFYTKNPQVPHPTIKIGFTPDEEIGRGHSLFPIKKFGADVAFTIDGSFDGDINTETFEAYTALVTITGVPTHPGMAKGKLVNAIRYMGMFLEKLPKEISPECTEGREGFIHPLEITGDATSCKCQLILRDFEEDKVRQLCRQIEQIAGSVAKEDERLTVDVEITFSYPNMQKFLKDKPEISRRLKKAVQLAEMNPEMNPVRGGPDGSNLSRKGLPTPNIFTGGMNFHGPTEWISTRSMGLSVCTVLNLMTLYSQEG